MLSLLSRAPPPGSRTSTSTPATQALADRCCAALGYVRRDDLEEAQTPEDDEPHPLDWPVPIVDPSGEGPLMRIVPVPEPRTGKNRMHFDVVGLTWPLPAGATMVRAQDDEIEWDVVADPEGNEFCVFAPRVT